MTNTGVNKSAWRIASIYLRLALGTAFLSAVADRFGLWGPPGTPQVGWGTFGNFLSYAAKVNPWFPLSWIPVVGWTATVCEIVFGITLIVGFKTRFAASLSSLLLLAFALGMAFGLGIKAPLDYSVFTASAGAFLLACAPGYPLSLDSIRAKDTASSL